MEQLTMKNGKQAVITFKQYTVIKRKQIKLQILKLRKELKFWKDAAK